MWKAEPAPARGEFGAEKTSRDAAGGSAGGRNRPGRRPSQVKHLFPNFVFVSRPFPPSHLSTVHSISRPSESFLLATAHRLIFSPCTRRPTPVARRQQQPRLSRSSGPPRTLHPSPRYSLCTPRRHRRLHAWVVSSRPRPSAQQQPSHHPQSNPRHLFRRSSTPGRLIFSLADDFPSAFRPLVALDPDMVCRPP